MPIENLISDTFGFLIIFVAAGLAVWQHRQYRNHEVDPWLRTKRRYRRRLVISLVLGLIGFTMVLESRQLLPTRQRPGLLVLYVSIMMLLAVLLVLLSIADVIETANSAASQSMRELGNEVANEKLRRAAEEAKAEVNQMLEK